MAEPKKKTALTGEQKAAALLISLGPELAAKVYQHLKEETVEQVTLQIANLRKITPEEKELGDARGSQYCSSPGVYFSGRRGICP